MASTPTSLPLTARPGSCPGLKQRLFVRDLISAGRTTSNAIWWVQQTGFTNNAAVVSEGVKKPESTIAFELKSTPVATIAHYFKAAKQLLDDFAELQSPSTTSCATA
jgi:HK97 family phage major capsid protein